VPIQVIAIISAVPVPLNTFPQVGNFLADKLFIGSFLVEILPCRKQSLSKKGSLHKIAAVIFFAERDNCTCITVYPVRPCPVKAIRIFEEIQNFKYSFDALIAGNKSSFDANKQRHYAKTTATACYSIFRVISLSCHSGGRVSVVVKIPESGFLNHIQKLIIGHVVGRNIYNVRKT